MSHDLLLPIAVGLGFAVIGSGFTLLGVRAVLRTRRFKETGVVTRAEVLHLRLRRMNTATSQDSGTWAPLVRFSLPDGRVIEAETIASSVPAPARPGQVVEVRYDPADPSRVNLAHGLTSGPALGCLFVAMGTGLALIGIAIAVGTAVVASHLN